MYKRQPLIAGTAVGVLGTLYFQWAWVPRMVPYKRSLEHVAACAEVREAVGRVKEYRYYHPLSFVLSSGVWDAQEMRWARWSDVGHVDEKRCFLTYRLEGERGEVLVKAEMRKMDAGMSSWKPWKMHCTVLPEEGEEQVIELANIQPEFPRTSAAKYTCCLLYTSPSPRD